MARRNSQYIYDDEPAPWKRRRKGRVQRDHQMEINWSAWEEADHSNYEVALPSQRNLPPPQRNIPPRTQLEREMSRSVSQEDADRSEEDEVGIPPQRNFPPPQKKVPTPQSNIPPQTQLEREMSRLVSQDDADRSEEDEVVPPPRRRGGERVQQPEHLNFLKNWDGVSYQFEIPGETLRNMPATLSQYWRVKSRNMKGMVIVKHHLYCYLFFTEQVQRSRFFEQLADAQYKDLKKVQKQMKKTVENIFKGLLPAKFEVEMTPDIVQILFQEKIPCIYLREEENEFHHMKKLEGGLKIKQVVTPAIHPGRNSYDLCLLAIVKDQSSVSMVVLEPRTNQFFVDKFTIGSGNTEEKIVQRILMRYTPAEILVANESENQIIQQVVSQMAQDIGNPFVALINLGVLKTDDLLKICYDSEGSLYMQELLGDYNQENTDMENFSRRPTVKVLKLVYKYLEGLGVIDLYFKQGFFSQRDEKRASPLSDLSAQEKMFKNFVVDNCLTHQGKKLIENYFDYPLFKRDEIQIQQCLSQILKLNQDVFLLYKQNQDFKELGINLGVLYHLNSNRSKTGRNIKVKTLLYAPSRRKKPISAYVLELTKLAKLLRRCQKYLKKFQELKIRLLWNKVKLVSFQQYQTTNEEQGVPQVSGILGGILTKDRLDRFKQYSNCIALCTFPKNQDQVKKQEQHWRKYFGSQDVQVVGDKNLLYVPQTAVIEKVIPSDFVKKYEKVLKHIHYIAFWVPKLQKLKKELQQLKINQYEQFKYQFYETLEQFCSYRVFWNKYVEASAWIDGLFSLATNQKWFSKSIRPGIPLENQNRQGVSPSRPSSRRESSHEQQMIQKQFSDSRTEEELLPNSQIMLKCLPEPRNEEGLPRTEQEVNNIMNQIEFCLNELQDYLSRLIKEQRYIFDQKQKISANLKRELKQNQEQFQKEYSQIASLMTKAKKLLSQNNLKTDVDLSMPLQKGEDVHRQNKKNNPFDDHKSSPSRLHKVVYNITQHFSQPEKVEYRDLLNLLAQVKKQTFNFFEGDTRKKAEQAFRQLQTVLKKCLIEKSKEEEMIQQFFKKLNQHFISQRKLRSEWQYLIQHNGESNIVHESLKIQIYQEQSKLNRFRHIVWQKQQDYNKILGQVHEDIGIIRVFCRIRPQNPNDPYSSIKAPTKESLILQKSQNEESLPYFFDHIFKQSDSQEAVFEEVKYLVQASVKGKNICIFCYGQAGTGKSHTMIGSIGGQKRGIIPRSVGCIFELIKKQNKKGRELNVTLQIKQIYLDALKDICEEKVLESKEGALGIISQALQSRVTSKTEKNNTSSRSHFILTLCLKNSSSQKIGSIVLIDLAGSERYSTTKNELQQEERNSINSSLFSFGDYLKQLNNLNQRVSHRLTKLEQIQSQQLVARSKSRSVSKKKETDKSIIHKFPNVLTDTLRPILENNCVALMLINVSPDASDYEQTKPNLDFGRKVKNIKLIRK